MWELQNGTFKNRNFEKPSEIATLKVERIHHDCKKVKFYLSGGFYGSNERKN